MNGDSYNFSVSYIILTNSSELELHVPILCSCLAQESNIILVLRFALSKYLQMNARISVYNPNQQVGYKFVYCYTVKLRTVTVVSCIECLCNESSPEIGQHACNRHYIKGLIFDGQTDRQTDRQTVS